MPRTKLTVPAPPPGLVRRSRLLARLDAAEDVPVTVVYAPAGSGKSVLLAQWVRAQDTRRGVLAWIGLEPADSDERRFWTAILAALGTADPALPQLEVPAQPAGDPEFLDSVAAAIEHLPPPVRLVLDDAHELADPRPLRGLIRLLRRRPDGLRVTVAVRDPAAVPQVRTETGRGEATIGPMDLRFTVAEARDLFAGVGVAPTADGVQRLVGDTDGWAAGLRLAAVALSTVDDPDRLVVDLVSDNRAIGDFLAEEVLGALTAVDRDLLTAICVAAPLPAELASALSGRADAGARLDRLAARTALVTTVRAPTSWYAVHAAVRTHLLAELARRSPEELARLDAVAADWFAKHGRPARALVHADRAGDVGRLLDLLRAHGAGLIHAGEHDLLRRLLDTVGGARVRAEAGLGLVSALLWLESGRPTAADDAWRAAEAVWPARPPADLVALRSDVRARRADVTGDRRPVRLAEPGLRVGEDAPALVRDGTALLAAHRRPEARHRFAAAVRVARAEGQDYLAVRARTMLGALAAADGDITDMARVAVDADEECARRGWRGTIAGATASVLLGYAALLRAEPAECLLRTRQAAEIAGPALVRSDDLVPADLPMLRLAVETLAGAAEFALGDRATGLRRMRAARAAATGSRLAAGQVALSGVLEHRAALRLGWSAAASEALGWTLDGLGSASDAGEARLMRARAQLSLGRRDPARRMLAPVLDGSAPLLLPWSAIEAWLLYAEAMLDDDRAARAAVEQAMRLAADVGVAYPLVSAPTVLGPLLDGIAQDTGFAVRVRALRRELDPGPATPLTARERAVLRLLPTQRSYDEIAEDLVVSANTVKTHVRAIYGKLGVARRRDAVRVAAERGLLEVEPAARS